MDSSFRMLCAGLKIVHAAPYGHDCSTIERRWSNVSLSHAASGNPDEQGRHCGGPARLSSPLAARQWKGRPEKGRPFAFGLNSMRIAHAISRTAPSAVSTSAGELRMPGVSRTCGVA